jgi:hypothetical protein
MSLVQLGKRTSYIFDVIASPQFVRMPVLRLPPVSIRERPAEIESRLTVDGDATGNLFAFLKPQCCQGSPARRRRDPSIEYYDPLNAGLVLPFQRPRDVPVLPPLSQLGLLRCRQPNPQRHHGTPPHLVRLEGVALIG